MMERKKFSFDGIGINGPDEYRSRIATLVKDDSIPREVFNGSRQEAGLFIARAMNSHDALVAALSAALNYYGDGLDKDDPQEVALHKRMQAALDMARQ